jgi:transcriptional regulator with XRE-family HTH domain
MTLDEFLSKSGKPALTFAEQVGITPAQLSRIRHGHSRPSWETAKRISNLTNGQVSTVCLMEGRDDQPEAATQ